MLDGTAYYILCAVALGGTYLLSAFYISVCYHRGLTHGAVRLRPWLVRFVAATGNWVTGLDPKGWTCMHRMHHLNSDRPNDPHSPVILGVFPLMIGQLKSYKHTLRNLLMGRGPEASLVTDLDFPVNWLNRRKMWWMPYALHATLAVVFGVVTGAWLLASSYWLGMMSHPIQGWMVNALGHTFGYRNFNTPDNSRNNTLVAWLVVGEGYQNNHHERPNSARFSVKWYEFDLGYLFCRVGARLRMLEIVGL